jgi:predicted TIM-barrel fold metal-dependent hydrolase
MSAPYRLVQESGDYGEVEPFVAAVVAAFGTDRCVWGSDWPFIAVANRPDYEGELAALARWVPDAAARKAVLWDNPCRLFGFGKAAQ